MTIERKKGLWIGPAEGTYSDDGGNNGSAYLWSPALTLSRRRRTKVPMPTNYQTGRGLPTLPDPDGPDGGTFDVVYPLIGNATAANDGAAPPADDWLDRILIHIFGNQILTNGEGAASATASSITLDAPATGIGVQSLLPVWEDNLPTSDRLERTQWAYVTNAPGGNVFDVAPNWTANPTTNAICFGTKIYHPDNDGGGATLSAVYREEVADYTLYGLRFTAWSIFIPAKGRSELRLSCRYDRELQEVKASLPASGTGPTLRSLKGMNSPVWFNGTRYGVKSVEIAGGMETSEDEATEGINGRAGDEVIDMAPTVTIMPNKTTGFWDMPAAGTSGRLLCQLGAGRFASSILNSMCFAAESATVMEAPDQEDGKRLRSSVKLQINDAVTIGAATARHFMVARA